MDHATSALARGDYDKALEQSDEAADADPLSPTPLLTRAEVELAAGRTADAQETLEHAVLSFPGDPRSWVRLARFQLVTLDQPARALQTVRGALYLDRFSREAHTIFLSSRAALRQP